MNLTELHSFKLSDALYFHKDLNPAIFDGDRMNEQVRQQLLIIANDFIEHLGINDLDVQDITISGSNAAYSYTRHSDIDLHIVVDMNKFANDDIYRELFDAKKIVYNEQHDIYINNYEVELYVQDSNQPHISLGEYSVLHDKWNRLPKKQKANFDQAATKLKYQKLSKLAEFAIKSNSFPKIERVWKTIKKYRQAGLDLNGEFGPENLAYKALRNNGVITKLREKLDYLHSQRLSIPESKLLDKPELTTTQLAKKHKVSRQEIENQLKKGIKVEMEHTSKYSVAKEIALDHLAEKPDYYDKLQKVDLEETTVNPKIFNDIENSLPMFGTKPVLIGDYMFDARTFRGSRGDFDAKGLQIRAYDPKKPKGSKSIGSVDFVVRTDKKGNSWLESDDTEVDEEYQGKGVAYLMYAYAKSLGNDIKDSPYKSMAGAKMWDKWGSDAKNLMKESNVTFAGRDIMSFKSPKGGIPTMMIMTGQGSRYLITNDGMVLRNKSFHANTGGEDQGLKSWSDAIEFYDPSELPGGTSFPMSVSKAVEKKLPVTLSNTKEGKRALLIYDGSQWRVAKISDIYKNVASNDAPIISTYSKTPKLNWNVLDYNLGPNNILKSVHPGSPVTHGMNLSKTKDLTEVSGYIPSEKEKNDNRFKTALTVDVKPDTIKKNANAFGFKVSRAGIPPLLRK